jgi:WD40 repeat protein
VSFIGTIFGVISCVCHSPCETYLQSSGTDNRCLVYDVRYPNFPVHILSHNLPSGTQDAADLIGLNSTSWTHYGNLIVTGGEDGEVRIWDVTAGNPLCCVLRCGHAHISSLEISPHDDMIVCGDENGGVHLFALPDSHYQLYGCKILSGGVEQQNLQSTA